MENSSNTNDNGDQNTSIVSMETVDQVATWVSTTVISAFFSSLDRFSCVNVSTINDDDDDDDDDVAEDSKERPLALSSNPHPHDDVV